MTKGIIELHGGTISVESREAEMSHSGYTRFTIFLPFELHQLYKNHQSSQEPIEETELFNEFVPTMEGDSQDRQQSHRYSILLVEDNVEIRNCLKSVLSFSYNILEASSGADALTLTNQELPDLVISDITMPGMDGLEFTRLVKSDERTNHIPVILLTARGSTDQYTEGISTGADDYITKPFHNKILEIKIRNFLVIREKLKEKYHRIVTLEPHHEEIEDWEESV